MGNTSKIILFSFKINRLKSSNLHRFQWSFKAPVIYTVLKLKWMHSTSIWIIEELWSIYFEEFFFGHWQLSCLRLNFYCFHRKSVILVCALSDWFYIYKKTRTTTKLVTADMHSSRNIQIITPFLYVKISLEWRYEKQTWLCF